MFSNRSAGPFFSSTRLATAPISRSQSTSAVTRRSSPAFSRSFIQSRMSMKPIVVPQLPSRPLIGPSYGTNDCADKALVIRGQALLISGCKAALAGPHDAKHRSKLQSNSIASSARPSSIAGTSRGIRGTGFMECQGGSVRLGAGELDHLCPFLRFLGDLLCEVGRRPDQHRFTEIGNPRSHSLIGKHGIDRPVKLVDDLVGRIPRCADAIPVARLVVWYELAHRRK